jgi:hypothetical protein
MSLFALPLAFVLSLAPTGSTSRFELDLDGNFLVRAWTGPSAGRQVGPTLGGGAGPGLSIFGKRVVDDEGPVSLQPFLQRVSIYRLAVGGHGSASLATNGDVDSSDYGGGVTASAKIYLHRNFFLDAGFGALQSTRTYSGVVSATRSSMSLPTSIGFGVRFYDAEVAVTYRIDPAQTFAPDGTKRFEVPFWGEVDLSGFVVIRRRVSLSVGVTTEEGGASARFGLGGYFGRRLSIGGSLYGGRGELHDYGSSYPHQWVGGNVGMFFWTQRLVGFGISYSPTWYSYNPSDPSSLNHLLSFTVSSRL